MAELVRQHAGHFLAAEVLQQAGIDRDRGMLGAAAGGEGVRLVLVDQVDLRHRQAGALGQLLDDAVELGRLVGPDLLRVGHAQDHAVAVPVGEEVHAQRHDQRDDQAGLAAEQVADDQEEAREGRQQEGGAEVVHAENMAPDGGKSSRTAASCGP